MFDPPSPPQLPVPPLKTPPLPPPIPERPKPPIPAGGEGPQAVLTTASPKKEPEDIFSGITETPRTTPSQEIPFESVKKFPWKWLLIALGACAGIAVIAFVVWKFVLSKPKAEQPSQAVKPAEQVETPLIPEVAQPTTTPPAGVVIPAPTVPTAENTGGQLVDGADSDGDGLSDAEEPFYDADLFNRDTDGDTYADGTEVRKFFDPSVKGGKLADAKFMSKLSWGDISVFAPKPWSFIVDPASPTKTALATGSATRFMFEQAPNAERLTLNAWLAREKISAPTRVTSRTTLEGRQTSDGLTTYFSLADKILIVTYDVNGDTSYDYRASYEMALHSLSIQ